MREDLPGGASMESLCAIVPVGMNNGKCKNDNKKEATSKLQEFSIPTANALEI